MKILKTFLNIAGVLLIVAGILLFSFCAMISDPEVEGDSGKTSLVAYFTSLNPSAIGILLLILSYKMKKNKISN
jgi:hypothetical protein